MTVQGDEWESIFRIISGPQHYSLIVDPGTGAVPSAQGAEILDGPGGSDKRVINKVNVPPNIEEKLARVKGAGHLPLVIECSCQAAAAIAQREVLPNPVAPEPEVGVAANVDRADNLAFLIDSPASGTVVPDPSIILITR